MSVKCLLVEKNEKKLGGKNQKKIKKIKKKRKKNMWEKIFLEKKKLKSILNLNLAIFCFFFAWYG